MSWFAIDFLGGSTTVLFLLLCLLTTTSCSDISLTVSEQIPPTFRFHKGFHSEVDSFPFFAVEEISPENLKRSYAQEERDKNRVIWRIAPKAEMWGTGILNRLPHITYGEVPDGFIQEIPENHNPPKLVEGTVYEASGAYTLMPHAVVRFRIVNSRVVLL